eukprot:CAMPEP_0201869194 /NCGR_PEP_ID=MMETSP0902-20130614/2798_1 /ASSEMBLY_ACC=CAM_ASM_000551 /TAXON_ID=420261 /ORGANISM="Thalassiosira antarctica, Strain CCMP982" /LENGTH=576 /DNA_ID=CAMNT_0048394659 /DNA_START=40 /DNA_END=1770 /DNA_ORIENTATION=+
MPSIKGTASISSTHALKKQLRSTTFPTNFIQKVNTGKVHRAVLTHWIETRVEQILGFEDEIVSSTAVHLFLPESSGGDYGADDPSSAAGGDYWDVDPRKAQLDLAGFLGEKEAASFASELWTMMLDAQRSPSGIPKVLVERKKEEMRRQREEQQQKMMMAGVARGGRTTAMMAGGGMAAAGGGGNSEMNAFVREAARRAEAARAAILADGSAAVPNNDAPPPAAAAAAAVRGANVANHAAGVANAASAARGPVPVPPSPSPPRGGRDGGKDNDQPRGDRRNYHNDNRGSGRNWDRSYKNEEPPRGSGGGRRGNDYYEDAPARGGGGGSKNDDYYIDRGGEQLDEFGRVIKRDTPRENNDKGSSNKQYKSNEGRKPPPREDDDKPNSEKPKAGRKSDVRAVVDVGDLTPRHAPVRDRIPCPHPLAPVQHPLTHDVAVILLAVVDDVLTPLQDRGLDHVQGRCHPRQHARNGIENHIIVPIEGTGGEVPAVVEAVAGVTVETEEKAGGAVKSNRKGIVDNKQSKKTERSSYKSSRSRDRDRRDPARGDGSRKRSGSFREDDSRRRRDGDNDQRSKKRY